MFVNYRRDPACARSLNGDTLHFNAHVDAAVEVGLSFDTAAVVPDSWIAGRSLLVEAPAGAGAVRVFARTTGECNTGEFFNRVYRIHESAFPTQEEAIGWTAFSAQDPPPADLGRRSGRVCDGQQPR